MVDEVGLTPAVASTIVWHVSQTVCGDTSAPFVVFRREVAHDAKHAAGGQEIGIEASVGGCGAEPMPTSLEAAVASYVRARTLARGTRDEYLSTVRKWKRWGGSVPIEALARKDIREFLEWVYETAVLEEGTNPGRTAKPRENLRVVMSWAWEHDLIESLPRFPRPRPQRDVAGRHYLTKSELNALYFAAHSMKRPRGWNGELPVGSYWRCALVMFFNYGIEIRKRCVTKPTAHQAILLHHLGLDLPTSLQQTEI